MTADLHKRLEEAADKYIKIITPDDIPYYHRNVKQGYIAGAESGYKEAIKMAEGWLNEKVYDGKYWGRDDEGAFLDADELLADFEADMNKLWEG